MADISDEDLALVNEAHDKLTKLKGTSDVQALVAKLVAGVLPFKAFIAALFALPSVQSLVLSIDSGAATGVGMLVAGATPPPFDMILGPGAKAVVKLGLDALAHRLLPSPSGPT